VSAPTPIIRGGSTTAGAPCPDELTEALRHLAAGRPIVLAADRHCGIPSSTLVFAAGLASAEVVAFTVRHTSGYVCVALSDEEAHRLDLPTMPTGADCGPEASVPLVAVDARHGVSTGISARDRARTIALLASATTTAGDLTRPGHVVPVRAPAIERSRGLDPAIAARALVADTGLSPVAAWADLVSPSDPSTMADAAGGATLAMQYHLPVVHPRDLVARIARSIPIVVCRGREVVDLDLGRATVTRFGEIDDGAGSGAEHLAFAFSAEARSAGPGLVRVHCECIAGDLVGSDGCGCRDHLRRALTSAATYGGLVLYLRSAGAVTGEGGRCTVVAQPPADARSALLASSMLAQLETVSRVER
jgi:3,4-dihydroxy 2-butanone 4-phosphate synthase/GTP cyclohydrolase II